MAEIARVNYGLQRLYRAFLFTIARSFPFMTGTARSRLYKLGGVQIINPKRVYIGYDVTIDSLNPEDVYISDGCVITSGTKIITHFYRPNDDCMYRGKVHIGKKVFISMNVLIINAVKIGDYAVIAAGAVVTRDVDPFTIVGGVPAKKIGDRNRNVTY